MQLARVQYDGGGDWYNDPEILPNLAAYANKNIYTDFSLKDKNIKLSDKRLYEYPFLFITGHGNIKFSADEVLALRRHLENGALLLADDDYGMDESFRREIKRVFPDKSFVELPTNHPIYNCYFKFPKGLPKTHEHDLGRPQLYALYSNDGRIMILYTFESNISDGWADYSTHNDPQEVKEEALKFGSNILYYYLNGGNINE
ncbi:MAG TPA: DUF4159 domain-containing protein [Candidatus Cloacimonadota bacterium]|jgi:hypothetical protein|nr:DUF4159 domain-containing protein [Candidatus Cloacimonadales bacterium]HPY95963.1 DUF4159 domain-containing protein [Candidatus Cloacimonadota bacterium]HQB40423.1 DUF4159 domain-containing protein [Candidatus Cloacimonadota bacterium]